MRSDKIRRNRRFAPSLTPPSCTADRQPRDDNPVVRRRVYQATIIWRTTNNATRDVARYVTGGKLSSWRQFRSWQSFVGETLSPVHSGVRELETLPGPRGNDCSLYLHGTNHSPSYHRLENGTRQTNVTPPPSRPFTHLALPLDVETRYITDSFFCSVVLTLERWFLNGVPRNYK